MHLDLSFFQIQRSLERDRLRHHVREDLRFDDADERELVTGLRLERDLNVDEARLESLDRPAKELRQTNAVVETARGEDGEIGNAVVDDGTFPNREPMRREGAACIEQ